jgi:hypothetical protein
MPNLRRYLLHIRQIAAAAPAATMPLAHDPRNGIWLHALLDHRQGA